MRKKREKGKKQEEEKYPERKRERDKRNTKRRTRERERHRARERDMDHPRRTGKNEEFKKRRFRRPGGHGGPRSMDWHVRNFWVRFCGVVWCVLCGVVVRPPGSGLRAPNYKATGNAPREVMV